MQQPPPVVVPAPKIEPRGAVGAIVLADQPFRLESVGMTMYLPAGTRTESARAAGRPTVVVLPEDQTYVLNIQTAETSNDQSTIQQAIDKTVALIQGSVGVLDPDQKTVLSTEARLIERVDTMEIGGQPAGRLYISLPEPDRKGRVVKGYTIFKPQPKLFVIFELLCAESLFGAARGVYETSVGTAKFVDSADLMLDRMAAIKAGQAAMARLTDHEIDAVINQGKERWFRMYRPGAGNVQDEEVGYYGVRFWRGVRGEIEPGKRAANYSATERQEGYLVRVRSRVLSGRSLGDNDGIFFVTPDRREEAWSIRTAAREIDGKQRAVASETGARVGDDLQVVRQEPGKAMETMKPPILSEGYISQFDTFLMPRVLARLGIEGEFGWYAYESWPSGSVTFRRDVVKKDKTMDGHVISVTSTLRHDSSPQVATFDLSGELLGTRLSDDGLVREPIDLESLRQIWQRKGLPTER